MCLRALPLLLIPLLVGLVILPSDDNSIPPTPTSDAAWTWVNTDSQIVAIHPDGTTNIIYDQPDRFLDRNLLGWRLSATQGLLLLNEDDFNIYMVVTRHEVQIVPLDVPMSGWPVEIQLPYVLVMSHGSHNTPYVLNIETLEVQALTGYMPAWESEGLRFLPDGETVRYLSYDEELNDSGVTLWERNLTTGEETALLSQDHTPVSSIVRGNFSVSLEDNLALLASPDGQAWWLADGWTPNHDTPAETDGSYQTLQTFGDTDERITEALYDGLIWSKGAGWVIAYDSSCNPDCAREFSAYALSGGGTITYRNVEPDTVPTQIRTMTSEGQLLGTDAQGRLWLYDADSAAYLGSYSRTTGDYAEFHEFNGRWILTEQVLEGDERLYQLWDVPSHQVVFEQTASLGFYPKYQADRVLLCQYQTQCFLYDAATQQTFTIPGDFADYRFDLLSNTRVLFEVGPDSAGLASGIYLLDVAIGESQLLVPAGRTVIYNPLV